MLISLAALLACARRARALLPHHLGHHRPVEHMSEQSRAACIRTNETRPLTTNHFTTTRPATSPVLLTEATMLLRSSSSLGVHALHELCSRIILDTNGLLTLHMSEQSKAARIRTTGTRPLTTDHPRSEARKPVFVFVLGSETVLLKSTSSSPVHSQHFAPALRQDPATSVRSVATQSDHAPCYTQTHRLSLDGMLAVNADFTAHDATGIAVATLPTRAWRAGAPPPHHRGQRRSAETAPQVNSQGCAQVWYRLTLGQPDNRPVLDFGSRF